jgi:hypothetical protein
MAMLISVSRHSRLNYVVIEAADQLTHPGVRIKAQAHALQMREQARAQVVDHPLAHARIQLPQQDVQPAAHQRDGQQGRHQPCQPVQILVRQGAVDQVPQDQGIQKRQAGSRQRD